MRKIENHCVDCGLPCLGKSCPYTDVEVAYCDECGNDGAEYSIDDKDYCEECAGQMLNDEWEDMALEEKAKLLDHSISKIFE